MARLKGDKFISFEEFIADGDTKKTPSAAMTAAEIEREFAPIVAADEAKRANNG